MWQENLRERESKGRGSFSATTYILTINGGSTAITTVSLKKKPFPTERQKPCTRKCM
jgi:hypothetical protein